MKRQIITLGLSLCTLASFAQWTLVKKFNKPTRFIESTLQGLVVATDSSYFIQQDPTFQNWSKYTLNDVIQHMDSKENYVYFASSKRIYEHLTAPIKIHELSGNSSFYSLSIYHGKKMVTMSSTYYGPYTFCLFSTPFGQFDTLNYTTTKDLQYLESVTSDDSVTFVGFNFYGGLLYGQSQNNWKFITPLEKEIIRDTYVNNSTIMARFTKGGTDFYISHDYGKTYVTKANAFPSINSSEATTMEYKDGNIFLSSSNANVTQTNSLKGVLQSSDEGQTWTEILTDSVITGMAIRGSNLYVTTIKGSLLMTTIKTIVTSVDKEEEGNTMPYYSNKTFYNNTRDRIEFLVHDLTGNIISKGTINSNDQIMININLGIYLVEYRNNKYIRREKIYVW